MSSNFFATSLIASSVVIESVMLRNDNYYIVSNACLSVVHIGNMERLVVHATVLNGVTSIE